MGYDSFEYGERERERERSSMNFTEVGSFGVVAILFWWIEGLKKL